MVLINNIPSVFSVGGHMSNVRSNLPLAFFRLVATNSYIFYSASKDSMFLSFPKYWICGCNNVFKGNTGSQPNMQKNGLSFQCSFSKKVYALIANGTTWYNSRTCIPYNVACRLLLTTDHQLIPSCLFFYFFVSRTET